MGFGVAAAHIVLFLAVASSGTLLVAAMNDTIEDTAKAQADAMERARDAANEKFTLTTSSYSTGPKRIIAEFRNDADHELDIDDVTLLVGGDYVQTSTAERFRVKEATASDVWLPSNTLEVWVRIECIAERVGGAVDRFVVVRKFARAASGVGDVIPFRVEPGSGFIVEIKAVS